MPPQHIMSDVASALPVIIVIACTAIVAIAISAWLVHDVAHRAIERSSPDKIPAVVLALGSLLHPLRLFLPWSSRGTEPDPLPYGRAAHVETPQNESSQAGQEGSGNEAQP